MGLEVHLVALNLLDVCSQEDRMRGFRVVKDDTAVFNFSKPGEYVLEDDDEWEDEEDEA